MWRIALSMALMFIAIGWAVGAMVLIFLVAPFFWESTLGKTGGAAGAVIAFGLAIWSASRIMRFADWLLGEHDSRAPTPSRLAAQADVITDWQAYSDDIARNKRWAFYRRTHQYDRLREMEEQRRAPAVGGPPARGSSARPAPEAGTTGTGD